MWVEFIVQVRCPCSERFFSGLSGFSLLKNQHFQIPIQFGESPQLLICSALH